MSAGPQVSMDSYAAEIGGNFTGHLTYSAEPDMDESVRELRVTLEYHTEGKGSTDYKVVHVTPIAPDAFGNANHSFTLPVPSDGPISYDGRIIRVVWEIKATVDLIHMRDHNTSVPVLVLPQNGWGMYQRPHPLRT